MRVLIISSAPWASDNCFGNTFSNIFEGIEGIQFANIYLRYGQPENDLDMRFFQITERSLLRNLKNPKNLSGMQIFVGEDKDEQPDKAAIKGTEQARKMRWQIMFWGRELIWKIGRWKSIQLQEFLNEFQPDLIFQPIYARPYINNLVLYVKSYTKVPMLGYISDDCYTLRQFNLSPLYWIDRIWNRKKIKAIIEKCEILYVISQIQKAELEKIFATPCKILTKSADFSQAPPKWKAPKDKVRMIYAGNIGAGRWKSLALISAAVARLNQEGDKVRLDIYSATSPTKVMIKELNNAGSELHEAVPYEDLVQYQKEADVLVHVEGLSLKSRLAVHQSFSTKLVDYFSMGKCIFAVGTDDVASIKHLKEHQAAVVAESETMVYARLKWLLSDTRRIMQYGQKAYRCGAEYHSRASMQNMLISDLKKVEKSSYESHTD